MTNNKPTGMRAFFEKVQVDRDVIVRKLGPANLVCGGWALLSIGLFVVLGAPFSGDRPNWFPLVVSLMKVGAFLISTLLCWRNARQSDILSGRNVWQAIAAGMAFHALGDITLILWRSLWGITSAVSLGDVFYGASYCFLAIGFFQAVLPRQTNLSWPQAIGISAAGLGGILLACWLNFYAPALATTGAATGVDLLASEPVASAPVNSATQDIANSSASQADKENRAPAIIRLIDQRLSKVTSKIGLLYVAGDCLLIVMAIALLIAFWGGTFSEAWKLIALAALCLYVADMFLIYTVGQGSYRPGSPWEIFWILSALFFGMGAGVEHGITEKMQQRRPRKQWL